MKIPLPPVSVVVIGRNEARHLDACLRAILDNGYPREALELIYVDSASTDDSVAIAKRHADEVVVAELPGPLPGLARNLGWRRTRYDLIHFVDGDTVLESGWIESAVRAIDEHADAFCVFGRLEETRPNANLYHRAYSFEWNAPSKRITEARTSGGNVLVDAVKLRDLGGFDETLEGGEEPDLCTRARLKEYRLLELGRVMARHDMDMCRFRDYWRRGVRCGASYAEIAKRFADTEIPLWVPEVRRNTTQPVLALVTFMAAGPLIGWRWAALGFAGVVFLLVGRKAIQARRAGRPWRTVLAYAVHVYFVKIPLLWGQLRGGHKPATTDALIVEEWRRGG